MREDIMDVLWAIAITAFLVGAMGFAGAVERGTIPFPF